MNFKSLAASSLTGNGNGIMLSLREPGRMETNGEVSGVEEHELKIISRKDTHQIAPMLLPADIAVKVCMSFCMSHGNNVVGIIFEGDVQQW